MENLFCNAFETAYREAVNIADDMYDIIVADIDEVNEGMKEIIACETLEEEKNIEQPTSLITEVKVKRRPPFAKLKTKFGRNSKIEIQPTSPNMVMNEQETSACEKQEQEDENKQEQEDETNADGWDNDSDNDSTARHISETFNQAIFPW